jgi:FKBP-type peptidyl-prolyl cis-trans isomerase
MIRFCCFLACAALLLGGCSEEKEAGRVYRDASDRMVAARAYMDAMAQAPNVTRTPSGLLYRVERANAQGAAPAHRDEVLVHYRGLLADGDEFDSSYDRNTPARFAVRDVIAGWREGLRLMRVGERFTFYIPPQLAYGASGRPPVIPPNAPLVFEVELLEVYAAAKPG